MLKHDAIPTVFPAHPHYKPQPAKRKQLVIHELPAKRQRKAQSPYDIIQEHHYFETSSAEDQLKITKVKLKKKEELRVLKQNIKRKSKQIAAKPQRKAQSPYDIIQEHNYFETSSAEDQLKITKVKLKKKEEELRVLKQNIKRKSKTIATLIDKLSP